MSALLTEHPEGLRAVLEDRTLSPADVRLYETLAQHGRALCADQVWSMGLVPGGRDAIRASMRRLKQGGHVKVRKRMISPGHWHNDQVFGWQIESPKWGLRLVPDLPEDLPQQPGAQVLEGLGVQVLGGLGVQSQSQSQEIKPEEEKSTLLRSTGRSRCTPKSAPASASRAQAPVPGAVRSSCPPTMTCTNTPTGPVPVPPKANMLRDRSCDDIDVADPMASTPVRSSHTAPVARGAHIRSSKPREQWNAVDLTAEFNSLAYQAGADVIPQQVNSRNLRGALARLIRNGSEPAVLAQCIELFFAKPSNLRNMGEGYPLWRRFLADITGTYGRAKKILNHDTITDNEHYAEDPVWAEKRAQMPAILAEARRIDEEYALAAAERDAQHVKALQERWDAPQGAITAPVSWMLTLAAQEAEKAAQRQAEHLRLKAESEARQAEHPDEEWIVEDEEEWIPSNDDAEVSA